MSEGKVWLVGAGPGDEGLLTIKGKKILETAEVIVYDALIGDAVCSGFPADAEVIYVGKRDKCHTMKQEEINELLVDYAKQGKQVVRLKGGDPFLFGRGGEEVEALVRADIPFEIIPGVPSALAVPAYNGIPVTHRDYSASVHIITGHRNKDRELDIDFQALYQAKGTYVFLMGVSTLPKICEGFLKAGMSPDMPAALLSRGTTAHQKKIVATVGTIERRIQEEGAARPAILVIGEVCSLSETFSWYETLPLFGVRTIVTRPKGRSKVLADKLRSLGSEVVEIPAIRTEPVQDQTLWEQELEQIASYDWIVFTSPAGVEIFFEKLQKQRMDIRCLGSAKLAAIGQGTAKKLEERGLIVDLIPEKYDGRSLGRAMAEAVQDGDRVLIPRARIGNQELVQKIQEKRQVEITDLPIYETYYESSQSEQLVSELSEQDNCIVVFTSASTVWGFAGITEGLDYRKVHAACIGEQTREAAASYGMQTYTAEEATIDSLVNAVVLMKEALFV